MGASKSDFFTDHQNEIANILKALGHPARIAIIEHLLRINSCICNDIVNIIPLSQPTISQHLKELKTAGLIQGAIEGNSLCYCLNHTTWEKIADYIHPFTQKDINMTECC